MPTVLRTMDLRRASYFKLSSQLAQMDNQRLLSMFETSRASTGWGRHQTVEIGQTKVFVKRVPVTDVEFDHAFSTRNLYDLPTYYNYGVGSAGFGVFRELVTHIKTTNWVLEGRIANFPLMYHYRIVPFSGPRAEVAPERVKDYLDYWNGHQSVERYWSDRARANHELVLFLEYMPYTLQPWLMDHPTQVHQSLDDLRATIAFLRAQGVIHFDAHFNNVVTDGSRAYLTDFGLVLDRSFALSEEEDRFFKKHTYYDYGVVLWSLGYLVTAMFNVLTDDDKRHVTNSLGVANGTQLRDPLALLVNNIEDVAAEGTLKLDASYVSTLVRYRGVIALMNDFLSDMHANNKKDTELRLAELRQLLEETGYVTPGTSPDIPDVEAGAVFAD